MPVENLTIRRAELGDYEAVYEMFKSPEVFAGTLQLPYPSREYWRKRIEANQEDVVCLVALVGERVIGLMCVEMFPNIPRRRHAGKIGISVHQEFHGKGVGSALLAAGVDLADNWLNLMRLELEVYADNEAAIRLYERYGFVYEGTLRQHAFRDGVYVDSNVMGRLRPLQV